MRLYVDVQPLLLDELESSKNIAVSSAQSAAQNAQAASSYLDSITAYKTNIELFYAQAVNNLTDLLSSSLSTLTSAKNTVLESVQSAKNTVLNSINTLLQQAVSLIQVQGQSIINQAQDYANQARDTVDNRISTELLAQSNALKTGSISNASVVFNNIMSYAHSTFDSSKFTVVGSPTVTSDGIASGFSSGNYLTKTLSQYITLDKINFYGSFTYNNASVSTNETIFHLGSSGAVGDTVIQMLLTTNNKIAVGLHNDTTWVGEYSANNTITANTKYFYHVYYANGKINVDLSTDAKNYTSVISESITVNSSYTQNTLVIGSTYTSSPLTNGSIDLKQFSITVDGVEVFSGNKTGIDTIKPDNYTVVGSPTITSDGVLSGIDSSNYVKAVFDKTPTSNYKIHFEGYINQTPTGSNIIYTNSTSVSQRVGLNSVVLEFHYGGASALSIYQANGLFTAGQRIKADLFCSATEQSINLDIDGTIKTATRSEAITLPNLKNFFIGIYSSLSSPFVCGSIDLNEFRVYVDDELVYQPCLKIPYTESKTGSKIADSAYRSRVNDMAEQFGYAPYYTLSDTDFTLPQGEVYGLIGQRTLRSSYRSGINYWEFYSDNTIEQGGSCTSGTDVTFIKSYNDTNYVLSVPYSAKTKTGFTPAASGDWVAKGKLY